jgi:hypothetical protein
LFTGAFPHLYIDHRKNSYSSSSFIESLSVAKIPMPKEFEEKFRFYSPTEYEIETLEIFTPDVFAQLIDLGWDHDMELVDGKLLIYKEMQFNTRADLEKELNKVEQFVDILSPRLNRFKLTQVGDLSPLLTK